MFTLTFSSYFGSPGESWLPINVVINWQLSKQGIRWPVSPDRIAGSGVDPSRSTIFLKLSADNLLVFKWSQVHVYLFLKFISNMLCLCQYRPVLLRFWFQTDLRRKNSASFFKIQAGKTFSNHGHVLVTLHVQFLFSDWSKFDRWVHAENLCSILKLFTLTAEADKVLCQLVTFLTVFFYWIYKMKFSWSRVFCYSLFIGFLV